ncbi:hypothetical protein MPC1_3110004 [Methylocella tundrae]|nr:hypothetical protein MPC1_3110004 [Methylocella tundrae]
MRFAPPLWFNLNNARLKLPSVRKHGDLGLIGAVPIL